MKHTTLWLALTLAVGAVAAEPGLSDLPGRSLVMVVGAAGEEEYGREFTRQARQWEEACQRAEVRLISIGTDEGDGQLDADRLKQVLAEEPRAGGEALWVVLVGHGTFDGKEARFNTRGPDFSATDLAAWLKPFERPLVVINTASASAPFLVGLKSTNRVVIAATRSGAEQNLTRFGGFLADAIAAPDADLDRDGQTSLLEAFLSAAARVAEFYKSAGRLATEHALIDDNGDGLGTPADWFRGVRATRKAADGASLDGIRAHQMPLVRGADEERLPASVRERRDALEQAVFQLRETKDQWDEDTYYAKLEKLLLDLARLTPAVGSDLYY